ncbi:hypothetical protein IQ06DRAFT_298194 [Phaeosphaeriaceae sp. SRC1lsM3a]|nr:hypothetical protein IQ06DRAFT_298194 [Stagonospora sp. SRC1lsM3a]
MYFSQIIVLALFAYIGGGAAIALPEIDSDAAAALADCDQKRDVEHAAQALCPFGYEDA